LLYTRAYNADSFAAQPAAIAIQIGKGLKGVSRNLYKSTNKNTSGELDSVVVTSTVEYGAIVNSYNELTGVLIVDAGWSWGSSTVHNFVFSDVSTQTSGYLVINASKSPALTGVPLLQPRIATLSDVKASGTNGGTFTSGAYVTRTLNTIDDPTGFVTSLASSQFILSAGEYYIDAFAPASMVGSLRAKIRNITDSTDSLLSESTYISPVSNITGTSVIQGRIVISSSKTFELQQRCSTTRATDGLGVGTGFGELEVFSRIKITKVK